MIKKTCLVLLIILIFPAVAESSQRKRHSQLEIRELQTHYFNTGDTKKVQSAVFSALQDAGFVISNYEDELGYLTAARDFKEKRTDKLRVTGYSTLLALQMASTVCSYGATAYYMVDPAMRLGNELRDKHIIVKTNVLVEPHGNQTKVRINMMEKVFVFADGYSYVKPSARSARRILSPAIYQELFNEIDKSLFIETQAL